MSCLFINKFLELAEPIPRKLIRHLKLLKEVEKISYNLNETLKERREQYLEKLREKSLKRNITLKSIKTLYKELLSLSDYKTEIINEIKYILENEFVNKINPIIEEGQNELELNIKKITYEDNNTTSVTDNEINPKKLLNKKRNKSYIKKSKEKEKEKEKENIHIENINKIRDLRDLKDVYCKCKRESYGKMIQCDNPDCGEWFHYECIGLKENYEPKEEWFCSDKCRLKAKRRFK